MEMKIHFGLILFLISSSLFASSQAEGKFKEKKKISIEVETLEVQVKIMSLLEQIKEQILEQNNEVIKNTKEISNGLKENTREIREITYQLKKNAEFTSKIDLEDFTSKIEDNTNGIKENTDESKKITININDIINKMGENNVKEIEVISQIKEITNDIKRDIEGLKEIVPVATNSTEYLEEIKDYLIPDRNCDDLRLKGDTTSGIRTVYPYPESHRKSVQVLCDQQTEGGGWTVFQSRENLPKRENFQRNWKDYSHGFGNLNGEFWMGLELLNVMSKVDVMELRVDRKYDDGEEVFGKFESFSVEDEDKKFKLNVGSSSGRLSSLSDNNQLPFTTKDRDHDNWSGNCAVDHKGAWWHKKCASVNLNAFSYLKTKMMFRLSRRNN